jgi:hypothetical protein
LTAARTSSRRAAEEYRKLRESTVLAMKTDPLRRGTTVVPDQTALKAARCKPGVAQAVSTATHHKMATSLYVPIPTTPPTSLTSAFLNRRQMSPTGAFCSSHARAVVSCGQP